MCKCSPVDTSFSDRELRVPYCGNGDCKPSDRWSKVQEKCPWKDMQMTYGPDEVALCRGATAEPYPWHSGDFAKHFCAEYNCAPYHILTANKGKEELTLIG